MIRTIIFCYTPMRQQYNKYKVRIYEDFFEKELTGQFIARTEQEAIAEAKEFYAMSLDTEPEEIVIISTEVI